MLGAEETNVGGQETNALVTGDPRLEANKQMVGDQGQCFTCGKILSNRWAAMRHFILVHSKNQIMKSDPCQECGKVFSNIQSLRDHLRRTHKVYASKSKYLPMN